MGHFLQTARSKRVVGVIPAPLPWVPLSPLPSPGKLTTAGRRLRDFPRLLPSPRGPTEQGLLKSWWVSSDLGRRGTGEGGTAASLARCRGELRGSPGHSPGMQGTGMLFSKRPRYPPHPILKHKPLCSPVLVPAAAPCQDVTGREFYSLSFQRSRRLAGPGWVSQGLRSKKRTKAEGQKYRRGDPWQGCPLPPEGGTQDGHRSFGRTDACGLHRPPHQRPPPRSAPTGVPQAKALQLPALQNGGIALKVKPLRRALGPSMPAPRAVGQGGAAVPRDQPAASASQMLPPPPQQLVARLCPAAKKPTVAAHKGKRLGGAGWRDWGAPEEGRRTFRLEAVEGPSQA